jgi:hypothetical protein
VFRGYIGLEEGPQYEHGSGPDVSGVPPTMAPLSIQRSQGWQQLARLSRHSSSLSAEVSSLSHLATSMSAISLVYLKRAYVTLAACQDRNGHLYDPQEWLR